MAKKTTIWRRVVAQGWYLWALSLCAWGHQTHERSWYEASVVALSRALAANPLHAPALLQLGVLYGRELGEYAHAVRELTRALAQRPDWPEALLQRGLLHCFAGSRAEAAADLTRYLELVREGEWRDEAQRQLDGLKGEG